jgi:hypothetical protein
VLAEGVSGTTGGSGAGVGAPGTPNLKRKPEASFAAGAGKSNLKGKKRRAAEVAAVLHPLMMPQPNGDVSWRCPVDGCDVVFTLPTSVLDHGKAKHPGVVIRQRPLQGAGVSGSGGGGGGGGGSKPVSKSSNRGTNLKSQSAGSDGATRSRGAVNKASATGGAHPPRTPGLVFATQCSAVRYSGVRCLRTAVDSVTHRCADHKDVTKWHPLGVRLPPRERVQGGLCDMATFTTYVFGKGCVCVRACVCGRGCNRARPLGPSRGPALLPPPHSI